MMPSCTMLLHDNNIIVMITFPSGLHRYTILMIMTTPTLVVDTGTDINIIGLL